MEYGQRLVLRQRNVGAAPDAGAPSTAACWFDAAVASGAAAAGDPAWGLVEGARADALVFSSPSRPWRDVLVAGRWAVRDHRIDGEARIVGAFAAAMHDLWRDS